MKDPMDLLTMLPHFILRDVLAHKYLIRDTLRCSCLLSSSEIVASADDLLKRFNFSRMDGNLICVMRAGNCHPLIASRNSEGNTFFVVVSDLSASLLIISDRAFLKYLHQTLSLEALLGRKEHHKFYVCG